MATTEVTGRRAVPVLALVFSLALHAAAFAALLADWRGQTPEEPVLSIELVIVSSPLESDSVEEAMAHIDQKAVVGFGLTRRRRPRPSILLGERGPHAAGRTTAPPRP